MDIGQPSKEKEKDKEYDDFEIKHCADMVIKAEEVKADPKKWALVQKELQSRKAALETLTGLDKMKDKVQKKLKSMKDSDSEY